jgi:peptide/bleomycin uptake transporter
MPGSLVWAALGVSIGGMCISWFVGIKLPGLEYNNQKIEAAFRKELVLGEDDKIRYASAETLASLFTGIRFNYHKLFFHYGYFDIWSNSFGQLLIVVPYVVMGPSLFAGTITLGVLMQVSNAFDKVQGSLGILIDNWTTITELRSIIKRLKQFEANLKHYEQPSLKQGPARA